MRKLVGVVAAVTALAACASQIATLAFPTTDAAFAQEIARWRPDPAPLGALKADLAARGFACRDTPPVEARSDYLLAACTLSKPHNPCTDEWRVDLRYAGGGERISARPHGDFLRRCA